MLGGSWRHFQTLGGTFNNGVFLYRGIWTMAFFTTRQHNVEGIRRKNHGKSRLIHDYSWSGIQQTDSKKETTIKDVLCFYIYAFIHIYTKKKYIYIYTSCPFAIPNPPFSSFFQAKRGDLNAVKTFLDKKKPLDSQDCWWKHHDESTVGFSTQQDETTPQKLLRFGTWILATPGIFGDSELGSNHHFKGAFVSFRGWEMSFVFVGILLGGDLVTKSSAGKRCTSFLRPPNLHVKSNIMLLLVKTRICLCFCLSIVFPNFFRSMALHFCGSKTSQDFKGITPLGYAIGANRIAVVKLLLDPRLWVCWDQRFDCCDAWRRSVSAKDLPKRLNFIRLGGCYVVGGFTFQRAFCFSNLALLGKMIIWLLFLN